MLGLSPSKVPVSQKQTRSCTKLRCTASGFQATASQVARLFCRGEVFSRILRVQGPSRPSRSTTMPATNGKALATVPRMIALMILNLTLTTVIPMTTDVRTPSPPQRRLLLACERYNYVELESSPDSHFMLHQTRCPFISPVNISRVQPPNSAIAKPESLRCNVGTEIENRTGKTREPSLMLRAKALCQTAPGELRLWGSQFGLGSWIEGLGFGVT